MNYNISYNKNIKLKMEQNVQILLNEEKAVNAEIQKALNEKSQLIRSIRGQAEIEVKQYEAKLEKEHQRKVAEMEAQLEKEGQKIQGQSTNLEVVQQEYADNKDKVIEILLKNVMTVDCEIPRVVKGIFE